MQTSTTKNRFKNIVVSGVFLLLIWQVIAMIVGKSLLFPTPFETLKALYNLILEKKTWVSASASLFRVLFAFLISLTFGIAIGVFQALLPWSRKFIRPILRIIQTTPVMTFIMISLLWFPIDAVPIFIGFLMGLPIIASSTLKGIQSIDKRLIEMSTLFGIGKKKMITNLYIPGIAPFLSLSMKNTISLTWKVCVASEVIGFPSNSIGKNLATAKVLLETEMLFAWTIIIILLSLFFESVFNLIVNKTLKGGVYDKDTVSL